MSFPTDGSSVDELIAALQVATRTERPPGQATEPAAVVVKNAAMKQVMATVLAEGTTITTADRTPRSTPYRL